MTYADDTLIFCLPQYSFMVDAICKATHFNPGQIERRTFPDGERYQRILSSVSDHQVILLGGTINDETTLSLYDLACALVKGGAQSLTLIIPYFGYATMERADRPGEVVVAKTRARLISAIPRADHGNRVLLFDLHNEGITHYFEGDITSIHIYGKPIILELLRRFGGNDFVLASTDAGRSKWVQSLANDLGVEAAFVFKRRLDGDQTEVTAMSAQVKGRKVVIYDDMIRTGGSLLRAAEAYQQAGAVDIDVVATHGVFVGDAFERLRDSGLFTHIACTDSHPRALELISHGLHVASMVPALVPYLRAI